MKGVQGMLVGHVSRYAVMGFWPPLTRYVSVRGCNISAETSLNNFLLIISS